MVNSKLTNKETIKDDGSVKEKERFISLALDRFRQCVDNSTKQRALSLEDLKFKRGENSDQWEEKDVRERENNKRPCLTANRILPIVNQVVNDGLQNRPQIKIRPVDNVTDPATADVIQGLIRHILSNGDSKDALDWSFDNAVSCGMGYFRVCTDYADDNSFYQDAYLERIDNPLSVYYPFHLCRKSDFSDAPFCFIREKISKEEYGDRFPDKPLESFSKNAVGDRNWEEQDCVWIAEYFIMREIPAKLYLLSDGSIVDKVPEQLPEGIALVKERDTTERQVLRYIITDGEILEEEKEFPSKYIPIIPVLGQEINIDGEKNFISLVRGAKGPQKMYNYWLTAFTEQVALAPKAPFLVEEGQIRGYETQWKQLNTSTQAFIPYKATNSQGNPVPAPQRMMPPDVGGAIPQGINISSEIIKETTGIYDASLGAGGNEHSGKAIIARQRQGDTTTYHFSNNFCRALRHLGRVLIDIIPKIYDTARTIRIIGEDMTDEVMLINQHHQVPGEPEKTQIFDLRNINCDVVVESGPSYDTKRVEAVENLTNLIQAAPQIGAVCSDIIVRNMEFSGSSELAERLKAQIQQQFPGVIQDKPKNGSVISETELRAIVADLQALHGQLGQSQQEKQQLIAMIQKMDAALKDKSEERQVKMDTTVIKAEAEVQKARLAHGHDLHDKTIDTALKLHSMVHPEPQLAQQGTAPAQNAENTPAQ